MKTKLGLLFFGLAASAMASAQAQAQAKSVRVMLMSYETANEIENRTGDDGQRYGSEWSKDAGELAKAGVPEDGNAFKAGFAPGACSKAPAQFSGYFISKARDLREAESGARRCPSVLRGGEVELRPMMPKMGAGE